MKLTIARKLTILAVIILVAFSAQSYSVISKDMEESRVVTGMERNSVLFHAASELIHELQKERGRTALSRVDNRQSAEIDSQRQSTQDKLKAFMEALKDNTLDKKNLEGVSGLPEELTVVRNNLQGKIPAEVIAAYSGLIKKVMGVQNAVANAKTTRGIGKVFTSLLILETAKENAGLLRASMSSLLAKDTPLPEDRLSLLITRKAGLDANLTSPALALGKESRQRLADIRESRSWAETDRVFALMVHKASTGKFGVDAGEFFTSMTGQIDDLSSVLKTELDQTRSRLLAIRQETSRALTYSLSFAIFSIVAALAVLLLTLRSITRPLRQLTEECNRLTQAALAGNLGYRADPDKINFEFQGIVRGINSTIDALTTPLNLAVTHVRRIARGDIPQAITEEYQGDFAILKNSLNECCANINALIEDADALARGAAEGRLGNRADETGHDGDFRRIVAGVNATLDAVITPLNTAAEYVDRIAKGDIPRPIESGFPGDFRLLRDNLNACTANINALIADANMLAEATIDGRLDVRSNADRHSGGYSHIMQGVNLALDAVITPLNTAAEYVDRIGRGDIPEKIVDEYQGDFNTLKNNLNNCIANITRLIEDGRALTRAAREGRLSTRADLARHQGDYRLIVEGFNATLDEITAPVRESAAVLEAMSQGDLTRTVHGDYQGDHAVIKDALNGSIAAIGTILADVNDVSAQLYIDAGKLSESSQSLSQGATEQAASLEEISSSMTELSAQTTTNAENAGQASLLAAEAKNAAERGSDQMRRMQTAMQEINEASRGIAKIIKVIDTIAFQTNLLALNAAVEAARAGRHGKGFAVVAEEVRNLAGRSAEAARETAALIEGSIKKVENGTEIAGLSSAALTEIVQAATKVADLVGEIAAASNEQAQGFTQVNLGLSLIDGVTQQNTANAEETAASGEQLAGQAERLNQLLSGFTLEGGYDDEPDSQTQITSGPAQAALPQADPFMVQVRRRLL